MSVRELSARIRRSAFPKASAFPPVLLQGKKILDVGCGYEALAAEGAAVYAIDAFTTPRPAALERIRFARSSMEALPFPDNSFEFVSSRNALYYSHMPTALREIRRVLNPGGMFWGTLPGLAEAATRLVSSLLIFKLADVAFVSYFFLNGILATVSGKQVRWINPQRCESVNTCTTIRGLLRRAGFEQITASYHDHKIIFSAKKTAVTKHVSSQLGELLDLDARTHPAAQTVDS